MQTIRIRLDQMHPAPYNPRVRLLPGDPAYDSLKTSIMEDGCVEPIVWNRRSGNIVGGHQRYFVLLDLGYEEDDVIPVDLDDTREKKLNLRLNKITGRWDNDLLRPLLTEIQEATELATLGFDDLEVERLLGAGDLDIDAFFKDKEPPSPDDATHKGEVQCPECGCWFQPKK